MKEALTLVMLVLLIAPVLLGVRRLRRTLDRAAGPGAAQGQVKDDKASR